MASLPSHRHVGSTHCADPTASGGVSPAIAALLCAQRKTRVQPDAPEWQSDSLNRYRFPAPVKRASDAATRSCAPPCRLRNCLTGANRQSGIFVSFVLKSFVHKTLTRHGFHGVKQVFILNTLLAQLFE